MNPDDDQPKEDDTQTTPPADQPADQPADNGGDNGGNVPAGDEEPKEGEEDKPADQGDGTQPA